MKIRKKYEKNLTRYPPIKAISTYKVTSQHIQKVLDGYSNYYKKKLKHSQEFHVIIEDQIKILTKIPNLEVSDLTLLKEDWKLNRARQMVFEELTMTPMLEEFGFEVDLQNKEALDQLAQLIPNAAIEYLGCQTLKEKSSDFEQIAEKELQIFLDQIGVK